MGALERLFAVRDPFAAERTEAVFVKAMQENCRYQYRHCPEYRKILDGIGFSPSDLNSTEALGELPFLPTALFKKHHLTSMPGWRIPVKATSSGTKGQFSKVGLELGALWNGLWMVLRMAKYRKLLSLRPVNYVILGYQPHKGNDMAVMKTAFGSTFLAPALHRCYALRYENGRYTADLEHVLEHLRRYVKAGHPVRFMGFPSYTYFLLQMMEDRNVHLQLPRGSKIMLGGGWKQFYREQVDKQALYDLIRRVLGVEEENIIEFFGAVEHPILYADCPAHHFHVPVYSRVLIRDVRTLRPVPNGTPGLVNLLTPMIKATPLCSVMTDDLGVLHDGCECLCGLKTPYLEIIGRVGLKEIRTCAAGAADILKGAAP
ncbi:MAG: acyl-protein synthetase [Oscillospiraceae bacterium]|nr:acyl-protein synthetase [Oscillospiraceae bacterium]